MHVDLVEYHANTQFLIVSPLCPHICEHVWSLLGKKELIVNEKWPVFAAVDHALLKEYEFILATIHEFRQKHHSMLKSKKGVVPSPPTKGMIYVASHYPPWQAEILKLLTNLTVVSFKGDRLY
jgi:leucyl-tRNA synthetase